jgi:TonB family protein
MNGELHFQAIPITLDFRQRTLFRFALAASLLLHIAGFLTSPYWQPISRTAEDIVTMDLAEIPAEEMPKLPPMKIEEPTPKVPRAIRTPSPAVPKPPPPSREMIRKRVASRGLLKMLSKEKEGSGPVGDPLSGIKVPSRLASKSKPVPSDYRPRGSLDEEVAPVKKKKPGIGKQVAATSKSSTALASKTFITDTGLEGEISGGIDDLNRSIGQIAATVKQYRSGIKYVYNKELLTNPRLSGKLTVSFVIRPDGTVERPEIRKSSLNWPSLEKAVLKRMRHWKFPKSRGAPVRVTFPFVFHPEM